MKKLDRRSALKIGVAAASAAGVNPVAAQQTTGGLTGKDTSLWPGVVVRTYGESPSIIPADCVKSRTEWIPPRRLTR